MTDTTTSSRVNPKRLVAALVAIGLASYLIIAMHYVAEARGLSYDYWTNGMATFGCYVPDNQRYSIAAPANCLNVPLTGRPEVTAFTLADWRFNDRHDPIYHYVPLDMLATTAGLVAVGVFIVRQKKRTQ